MKKESTTIKIFHRNHTIDIYRGITIFFVVFGHITKIEWLQVYIWSFHMPIFFVISGYLYNPEKYISYRDFFLKKFRSLIIPYLIFGIISYLYWLVVEYSVMSTGMDPWEQLFGFLYGTRLPPLLNFNGPLWFIPCLFSMSIIYYFVEKMKKPLWIGLIIVVLFIFGVLSNLFCPWLPFGICSACIGIVFYAVGRMIQYIKSFLYAIKENIEEHIIISFLIVMALITLQLLLSPYSKANLAFRETGNPIFYIFMALLGILVYWMLSVIIGKSKLLEYIGKNSLVIFTLHGPIYKALIYVTSLLTQKDIAIIRNDVIWCIAMAVMTFMVIVPFIIIWNRWGEPMTK